MTQKRKIPNGILPNPRWMQMNNYSGLQYIVRRNAEKFKHIFKLYSNIGPNSEHNLVLVYPEIAKQWDYEKNKDSPYDISPKSSKKRWFKCDKCKQSFETVVGNRVTRGGGCPYCKGLKISPRNCLSYTYPEIAKQWNYNKNKDNPNDVYGGSVKKRWFKCGICGESSFQSIRDKTKRNTGCPYCSGYKVGNKNSLKCKSKKLSEEWHPTKNIDLKPENIVVGFRKKVWWKCKKGHEWEAAVYSRWYGGNNCPYCSGRKVCSENCLATTHPHLAEEWHFVNNKNLTPYDISVGSNKKVWWKCKKCNNEWECIINARKRGRGCLKCKQNNINTKKH